MALIFNCVRKYLENATISTLYANGKKIGHVLEDIGRPTGIKIPGETCIPEGTYRMALTYSPKFKRKLPVIFNSVGKHAVEKAGVTFSGIRTHGGNKVDHTAGCPLVAKHTDGESKVWESIESQVTQMVSDAVTNLEDIFWIVSEEP